MRQDRSREGAVRAITFEDLRRQPFRLKPTRLLPEPFLSSADHPLTSRHPRTIVHSAFDWWPSARTPPFCWLPSRLLLVAVRQNSALRTPHSALPQGGPNQGGGANVALALDGVAPASIRVGVVLKP